MANATIYKYYCKPFVQQTLPLVIYNRLQKTSEAQATVDASRPGAGPRHAD